MCAILGTTYTGQYEDVQTLNDELAKKNKATGLDVHIHVDAASGGFVVPFVNPGLVWIFVYIKHGSSLILVPKLWDFRLPLVCSINVSG